MDEDDTLYLANSYGIVTDAKDWYFLHCEMDDDGKISFSLSEAITIKWSARHSANEIFESDVKDTLEHILWLLCRMEEAEAKIGVKWKNAPPENVDE